MTLPLTGLAPEIRPLTEGDLPIVTALYCAVFNAPPWNDAWTPETATTRLRDAFGTPGSLGLGAWQAGQLAGCLVGYREQWHDGVHFYLKELFVDPARQRRGIGTQLLQELTERLRGDRVSRIYLLTERDSDAANFYMARGYYQSPRITMMATRLEDAEGRPRGVRRDTQ